MPMETKAPVKPEGSLAREFSKLWASEPAGPDVFAFLAAHPEISDELRLDVLLVDQRERWARGISLPLRVYLSGFSEIAANGEMVRALVDGERAERRKSLGALVESLNPNTFDVSSETPTQPIEGEPAKDDTQVEGEGGRTAGAEPVTIDRELEPTGLRSTAQPHQREPDGGTALLRHG